MIHITDVLCGELVVCSGSDSHAPTEAGSAATTAVVGSLATVSACGFERAYRGEYAAATLLGRPSGAVPIVFARATGCNLIVSFPTQQIKVPDDVLRHIGSSVESKSLSVVCRLYLTTLVGAALCGKLDRACSMKKSR